MNRNDGYPSLSEAQLGWLAQSWDLDRRARQARRRSVFFKVAGFASIGWGVSHAFIEFVGAEGHANWQAWAGVFTALCGIITLLAAHKIANAAEALWQNAEVWHHRAFTLKTNDGNNEGE